MCKSSPTRLPSKMFCVTAVWFCSGACSILMQSSEGMKSRVIGMPVAHVGVPSAKPVLAGFGSPRNPTPKFGDARSSRYVVSLIEPVRVFCTSVRPVENATSQECLPSANLPSAPIESCSVVVTFRLPRASPRTYLRASCVRFTQTSCSGLTREFRSVCTSGGNGHAWDSVQPPTAGQLS